MKSRNVRMIARLDVKGSNLIKTVHLEGLRVVGDPSEKAIQYYLSGADEIIYIDLVASLYNRNNLSDVLKKTAKDVFIPITAGGGIRTVDDVQDLLNSGADKVAINTAIVNNPEFISQVSNKFGSQCMVGHIEAKRISQDSWEIYTDCARESTGIDAIQWAEELEKRGAGELLVTSIDNEGTRKGFDNDLIKAINSAVSLPIIASGGYGASNHILEVYNSGADAIAFADVLHIQNEEFSSLKAIAIEQGLNIRS